MSRYFILLLLALSFLTQIARAQDQGVPEPMEDDLETGDSEVTEQPENEEDGEITPLEPMQFTDIISYSLVKTDSLLRWELWANPLEWRHHESGNITYRLGGFGRNDGSILDGHEQRHQRVYHEGILFNDRVSGSMNSNRMPHHRFAEVFERSYSASHETEYINRRFYLTRPLTMISYDQGQLNHRSTEVLFSRNIGRETNMELMYWGKNDDGLYQNNEFSGRKASGRVFHHINERFIAETRILYNGLQLGEPNGYQIADMNQFAFLRFNALPVDGQARSSVRNSMFYATAWHRPDESSEVNAQLTAYQNRYRRFYYGGLDSTYYHVTTSGVQTRNWVEAGPLALQFSIHAEHSGIDNDTNRSLTRSSWMTYSGRANADFRITPFATLSGWGNVNSRSDGFQDHEAGTMIKLDFPVGFSVHAAYVMGENMPSVQQLYWSSNLYFGNSDLVNETINRVEAGVELRPWQTFRMGANVSRKDISNPIMMGLDNMFTQTRGYVSEGADLYASVDLPRFEADVSLTYQNFNTDSPIVLDQQLALSGSRIWNRASAFYKDYVFDSAAFVKAGGYVLFSPNLYRTGMYYPQMDYWDSNSFQQAIPPFHRMDLEVSARVRTVMVLMRVENVLNQVTQLGYFETALHPMPGRVLRFGIKWVLRN